MLSVSNPISDNNPFDTNPSLIEISQVKPNSCKACACKAAAINQQLKNAVSILEIEYDKPAAKKIYAKVKLFA